VSRRDALRYAAFAGMGLPLSQLLPRGAPEGSAQGSAPVGAARYPQPAFSLAERDRRWAAVRRIMQRAEWALDALITINSDLSGDSARYLTQIGGRPGRAEVVFPRDEGIPVHALVGTARDKEFWDARLGGWVADGRLVTHAQDGSSAIAEHLRAVGLGQPGTRIGVAKLAGSRFDPEGLASATYLDNLKAALPGILLVPLDQWGRDAGPIDDSAMHEGPEEHAAIRQAVAAGEMGIQTLIGATRARPQVQADLWFPTFEAMFAETGEEPTRLSIALDKPANSTLGAPVGDPFRMGQIISQEIDATAQGYRAQVNHSLFAGDRATPGFDYYRVTMEAAAQLFFEALRFIVPGKATCGELVDHYAATAEELGAEDRSGVVLHSSGIGNLSRPRLGPANSRGEQDIVLAPA